MKKIILLVLVSALFLFGCTQQNGQGGATATPTAVPISPEQAYKSEKPAVAAGWSPADKTGSAADEIYSKQDSLGGEVAMGIGRLPLDESFQNLQELGEDAIVQLNLENPSAEEIEIVFVQNQKINKFGAKEWFVICYSYEIDEAGTTARDRCSAITVCNEQEVVGTLSAPHGRIEAYSADFGKMLESTKCA